jgi:hypothetical protein
LKKPGIFIIVSVLLFNILLISPEPLNLTDNAAAIKYSLDTDLCNASASFIGENPYDLAGYPIVGAGDVNGDGFDDILIGANLNCDGGYEAGKVYLVFGKSSGFEMDQNLSTADASFLGENPNDWAGFSLAAAGDVNGDGFDDILIGSHLNSEFQTNAGQVYLIFGKASGWTGNVSLSTANASFIGEAAWDWAGYSIAGAGDVNGDGFEDILIGSYWNNEAGSGAGQVYLIFGKTNGWAIDTSLADADASFWGEDDWNGLGYDVACAGNVNGDRFDDFIISER